jgi:hypothetical protein
MFGALSDSSLTTWTFWLQVLGVAGAIALLISLFGLHFVSTEQMARTSAKSPIENVTFHVSPATKPAPAMVLPELHRMSLIPGGREVTEEQTRTFMSELDEAPKGALQVIIADEKDDEVRTYAEQLRVLLVLAGYNAGPRVETNSTPLSLPGVWIVVQDLSHAPRFAGAIQNGLKAVGIDARSAKDGDFRTDQVAVFVGGKK